MLKRGTFHFTSGDMPNPIIFKTCGFFVDPLSHLTHWAQLVRFRFFENDRPSELCFDFDFERTDWEFPLSKHEGPSLNETIGILMRAENKWEKVNFLPKKETVRQGLRLVISGTSPS